jgi:hypothetical protein
MKAESRFRFKLFFLTATLAVFATVLVLLLEFHVGHGARARTFAGVPRDAWHHDTVGFADLKKGFHRKPGENRNDQRVTMNLIFVLKKFFPPSM